LISKQICVDPEYNAMSVDARELFMRAVVNVDRDGLVTGHAAKLWAILDPFHADRLPRMGEYIQEWVAAGSVLCYHTGREQVLFFKNFRRYNQNIPYEHEAPSTYPPPPGWRRTPVGLVPEDPSLRLVLAPAFDPRSTYRKAILDPDAVEQAFKSRLGRDLVARSSRSHREKVAYQDQDHVIGDDGDQSITPSPQGIDQHHHISAHSTDQTFDPDDNPAPDQATHLLEFPARSLRRAAIELGPLIFGSDFRGYGRYVAEADVGALLGLLEWMAYFWHRMDRTEGIRELPAYVRSCLKNSDRPGLTTKERQWLFEQVAQAQGV
jgi:hypothetical protein